MVGEESTHNNNNNNNYSAYHNPSQSYNNSYVYYPPPHSYPQHYYSPPPIYYSVPYYQDPSHYYYHSNNYHHSTSSGPVEYNKQPYYPNNSNNSNNPRRQRTTVYSNPYTYQNNKQDDNNNNISKGPFQPRIYEPINSNSPKHSTHLPRIIFQGEIIVVNSVEKVKPALDALFRDGTAASHGVGFDMEWKPNFGKGSQRNPTSLIQLSTDKVCVIFWMMHLDNKMPLELFEVLASPDILKIGQSLDCGDNERLSQDFHLFLTNSVDISIVAKRKGFKKTNLKEQTRVLLGKNLSKFLCTSNWADVHLTPAQIRYAATDPYVTFLIYHKLVALPDAPIPAVAPPFDDDFENENGNESESEEGSNEDIAAGLSSLSI